MNLKIVIEAILKGQGIQATAQQVDTLAGNLEKAAQAGKPLETSTEAIVDQFKQLGTETKKAAEVTDEMKKEAQDAAFWLQFYSRNGGNAADATKRLGQQVTDLSRAAGGAKQVVDGLSNGGFGGLITAGRGALATIKALATSGLGLVLLPLLAAAAAAIYALNRALNSNREQMKKWADESAAAAEAYKARVTVVMAEVNEQVRQQVEIIAELDSNFQELLGRIEGATKRTQSRTDAERSAEDAGLAAEEQKALAKSSTPQEREDIKRQFARRRTDTQFAREQQDLTNTELGATVREKAASEAIAQARVERDQLQGQLLQAQERASAAEIAARTEFNVDPTSQATRLAQGEARALAEALKPIEEELKKRNETITRAESEIDAVRVTRDELPFRRSALNSRREAELTARGMEDRDTEISRREAARQRDIQDRADLTGAGLEDLAANGLTGPKTQQNPALKGALEKLRGAAQEIQGEADVQELTTAIDAIVEFSKATQGQESAFKQQIFRLGDELVRLRTRVDAMRITR